jgi:hypothetical protein
MDCVNVDCGSSEDPAFCERFDNSTEFTCRCVSAPYWGEAGNQTVNRDQPTDSYPPKPGCEKRFVMRPAWTLTQAVDASHVETF